MSVLFEVCLGVGLSVLCMALGVWLSRRRGGSWRTTYRRHEGLSDAERK